MTTPRRRLETPRRRHRIIAAAAAGLVLVAVVGTLLLSGPLSGSDDDAENAAEGTPGSSSSTGATATPGASGAAGTATPGAQSTSSSTIDPSEDAIITPSELEQFLLRGSDLPGGWRTLDEADKALRTLIGTCAREAITPTVPHVLKTTAFRSGSNGPVLSSSVRDFTTPAQSFRAMSEVRSALLKCRSAKPALETFPLTSKADASIAVTFTITQKSSMVRGEILVVQVGARSATVALVGLTQKDLEIGEDAVRTMIARLD